jgi:sortase A
MRSKLSTGIMIGMLILGLSLLLYPSISDYWNSFHQTRVISKYVEAVADMDNAEYQSIMSQAVDYNKRLASRGFSLRLTDKEKEEYNKQLNITDDGVMGYIEIPVINCTLPIYHGTDDAAIEVGVGHIEGSSLPVGGESTHCVLSSHRGLPSAKLFTNLDKLVEGDTFMLRVLDETLTYEVDQILIVLPENVDALQIEEGKDYCTLVTCTPYGVNTHRMLVRGHRVDNNIDDIRVTADATQIEPLAVAPFAALPLLFIMWLWLMLSTRRKPYVSLKNNSVRKDESDL